MKNLILIIACLFPSIVFSQVIVDGVNLNDEKRISMVEIIASGDIYTEKVIIILDFGDHRNYFNDEGKQKRVQGAGKNFMGVSKGGEKKFKESTVFEDTKGNKWTFLSPISAVNYMETNGWELVEVFQSAYLKGWQGSGAFHYIFRKKK